MDANNEERSQRMVHFLPVFGLELYPYCFFNGHVIVFTAKRVVKSMYMCVGVLPETPSKAENSRFKKKEIQAKD